MKFDCPLAHASVATQTIGHRDERRAEPRVDRVIALVERCQKVSRAQLMHRSRCRRHVAHARQLAMYLIHVDLGHTMAETGSVFGRDRTTVSHACACVEDRRDDPAFDALVDSLEDALMTGAEPARATQAPAAGAFHA